MRDWEHTELPDELQQVATHLHDNRHGASPVELDELKRRAMSQAARPRRAAGLRLRSQMVTLLLVLGLALSGGAAGVIAGKGSTNQVTSAAKSEYKCNSGNGNGPEIPPTGESPDCDPGNSPDNNNDNDFEGPDSGQKPPPPRRP